jgi:hypothetical protein
MAADVTIKPYRKRSAMLQESIFRRPAEVRRKRIWFSGRTVLVPIAGANRCMRLVHEPAAIRILIVDDELSLLTATGRTTRAVIDELEARPVHVVQGFSPDDGASVVLSDPSIRCYILGWGPDDLREGRVPTPVPHPSFAWYGSATPEFRSFSRPSGIMRRISRPRSSGR